MEQERRDIQEKEAQEGMVEDAGRKGGAASMAAGMPMAEERTMVAYGLRDMVRWGPIWAGLLSALGIQIVLSAIGLAVALSSSDVAAPNYAQRVGSILGIWSAISSLVALFIGGYIAGRMGAVLGLRNGIIQGTVVWALLLVLSIFLSGLGIAGFLGTALNTNQLMGALNSSVSAQEVRSVAATASRGAWWFVIGSILAWAAAAGGAVIGTSRHEDAIEESTRR